jgi:hypothetical protein
MKHDLVGHGAPAESELTWPAGIACQVHLFYRHVKFSYTHSHRCQEICLRSIFVWQSSFCFVFGGYSASVRLPQTSPLRLAYTMGYFRQGSPSSSTLSPHQLVLRFFAATSSDQFTAPVLRKTRASNDCVLEMNFCRTSNTTDALDICLKLPG